MALAPVNAEEDKDRWLRQRDGELGEQRWQITDHKKSVQPTAILGKALAGDQNCRNSGECSPRHFLWPFPDRGQLLLLPPLSHPLLWLALFVEGSRGMGDFAFFMHFSNQYPQNRNEIEWFGRD